MKRELFALGCVIYEITAWQVPFGEVDSEEAERLYERGCFPPLDRNLLGNVIRNCWNEVFNDADEVVSQLKIYPARAMV